MLVTRRSFSSLFRFSPRVLCPGSGLGRLPFEVSRRGYACQGNEFSYFMLIGTHPTLGLGGAEQTVVAAPLL